MKKVNIGVKINLQTWNIPGKLQNEFGAPD